MADVVDLFRRAVAGFDARVRAVSNGQWHAATPCTEWDVHALLNHIVNEDKWATPLLEGRTMDEVGDRFDGDLLGGAPAEAWALASKEAIAAVEADGALDGTVHVSFGDIGGSEYVSQLVFDHTVHAWDLARAVGADDRLDPELCEFSYEAVKPVIEMFRGYGVFAEKVEVDDGADIQTKLLALVGRRA